MMTFQSSSTPPSGAEHDEQRHIELAMGMWAADMSIESFAGLGAGENQEDCLATGPQEFALWKNIRFGQHMGVFWSMLQMHAGGFTLPPKAGGALNPGWLWLTWRQGITKRGPLLGLFHFEITGKVPSLRQTQDTSDIHGCTVLFKKT